MKGVRGEAGMKEGGAGKDSRSSGTMTVEILGGLLVDMGWNTEGVLREVGGGTGR